MKKVMKEMNTKLSLLILGQYVTSVRDLMKCSHEFLSALSQLRFST